MRVCIITCSNALNYGARLQAFALQAYIESLGNEALIIDYEPDYVRFNTKRWYNPGLNIKEWAKLILRVGQRKSDIRKHARLEEFSRKHLHLTDKYHSLQELQDNPPEADIYIAGSDQIWNTTLRNGLDPAYYLDFGQALTRRISYAASIALPEIPVEHQEFVGSQLQNLDAITVREPSAVQIVKNLSGKEAQIVCDPVFLHDREFWADFADDTGEGQKYLLVYDFESSEAMRKTAREIARMHGLQIYSVSPRPLRYADRNYCDCSPQTFVALIKNASHVVCNSLHGTIFSIIFDRPFTIVDREDGLNLRMRELLTYYCNQHDLKEHIVKSKSIIAQLLG